MRSTPGLCTLAFALTVTVSASAQESGAELYAGACAACHGVDGGGNPPSLVGFDLALPDFTDCDFAVREPDADWYAIIHNGGPTRGFDRMMPAFGEALSPEQIRSILDHVRTMCRDDRWPPGDFNLPRALFTEKAYPEDEAVITTTLQGEGQDRLAHEFLWEQRFGPRNQIEISLPIEVADFGGSEDYIGRFGDLAVGVKHNVGYSVERGSILSVGGELVLPTGDDELGFGKGTAVFETYVSWGKLLRNDAFFQFQGIAEFPTESHFDDEVALRGAIGRTWTTGGPFGRSWTPMLEVLGSRELGSGHSTQWDVVPQFQVSLNTRQHILANLGFRIPATDSDIRETQFVFYLLWDWFDGGVREGW